MRSGDSSVTDDEVPGRATATGCRAACASAHARVLTGPRGTRVVLWPPHARIYLRRAMLGPADMGGAAYQIESTNGSASESKSASEGKDTSEGASGRETEVLAEGTLPEQSDEEPLLVGLPDAASTVTLIVWPFGKGEREGPSYTWQLEATPSAEPANRLKGAQQRLCNLGYPGVEITGEKDAATERALKRFQRVFDEQGDGRLDEQTARLLEAIYDQE